MRADKQVGSSVMMVAHSTTICNTEISAPFQKQLHVIVFKTDGVIHYNIQLLFKSSGSMKLLPSWCLVTMNSRSDAFYQFDMYSSGARNKRWQSKSNKEQKGYVSRTWGCWVYIKKINRWISFVLSSFFLLGFF